MDQFTIANIGNGIIARDNSVSLIDEEKTNINGIIELLMKWCADKGYCTGIEVYGMGEEIWVKVKLSLHNKSISRSFYVAGGSARSSNWSARNCLELNTFLKEAEEGLKG